MALEIERKFLVVSDAWRDGAVGVPYSQGYVETCGATSVRVRVAGDKGGLTLKGAPLADDGLSRFEFEYPVPVNDAKEMLALFCQKQRIIKTRFRVVYETLVWEVDVFEGENQGLVMAEVELSHHAQDVVLPSWVGKEVTLDKAYTNAALSKNPFKTWNQNL